MPKEIYIRGKSALLKPVISELLGIYQLIEDKDIGIVLADDNSSPPVRRRGRPKIVLCFQENSNFRATGTRSTIAHGRRRTRGVISFRLMDETPATFSEGNQQTIARKIKEVFAANEGFVWTKGKDLYAYTDWDLGYQLELLTRSEAEARRITTAVLSIQSHTPNWSKLTHSEAAQPELKYPILPGKKIIGGKEVAQIEQRPVVNVRFQYAYASIEGLSDPIGLYDRTGKLPSVLVE